MSELSVGDKAPEFTLQDQHGQTVSSADFLGSKNVVLYFYPRALTPGCTVQACKIRDNSDDFTALDTVVFGVSGDPLKRLLKFDEKHTLGFPLLSDPEHKVQEAYGTWGPKKFMGREFLGTKRQSFIIDKEGVVRLIMSKVKVKTHDADVLAFIRENLA